MKNAIGFAVLVALGAAAWALLPHGGIAIRSDVAAESKAEGTDALEERLRSLEHELQALRGSPARSLEARPAAQPASQLAPRPTPQLEHDLGRRHATETAKREQAALEYAMRAELRDEAWAANSEAELRQAFQRLPELPPREVRCASTLCEVVIDVGDGVEPSEVAALSANAAPNMGEQVGYVTPDAPHTAVIYIARAPEVRLPQPGAR